jgi:hypothetical protein
VNDPVGPAVNISGVANFGTLTSSPTARTLDLFEFNDGLSRVRGYHSIKAGVDFLDERTTIVFPGAQQGVYAFSSMANFIAGRYATFQQAFGPAAQEVSDRALGAYIQDEWRPRPSLTLNAGLRYDLSALPDPIQPDARNVAPRIGIAYSPAQRRFVIRAGFGLYYGRVPLRAVSNALQRDGTKYRTAVLPFGQDGALAFPNVLPAFPAGLLASISTIDPHIRNDYSVQADVQVEREIARGAVISAGYQHLRGTHLILQRNLNVPTDPALPNLGRPDSRFGNISQYESAGDSYYNGLSVSFTERASRWFSARVSYTFSKAIDDTGNFFFSAPQNNFNLRDDRGLSDNDQRHRVSASGTLDFKGWRLSGILSYASALPFNVQTGADRNGDTTVNDRPFAVGRNTGRGFDSFSVDTRVSRRFALTDRVSLEALAEAFNAANRANWQFPNNIIGTGATPLPSFGRPTGAGDARQMQLGLRLSF